MRLGDFLNPPLSPFAKGGVVLRNTFLIKSLSFYEKIPQLQNPLSQRGQGDFMIPYNKKSKEKARKLRRNMTLAEKKIWYELLRKDKLEGFRFLRQKPLDNYIADFYCNELKLIIEIDGESHLSADAREYDAHRTKVLNGYGIEVVRYTNDEILNRLDKVKTDLKEKVNERKGKAIVGNKIGRE